MGCTSNSAQSPYRDLAYSTAALDASYPWTEEAPCSFNIRQPYPLPQPISATFRPPAN
jgi:hypothetical protein